MEATLRLQLPHMAGRRVFHQELGAFFKALRDNRGWGFRQAVQIAEGAHLTALTRQTLAGLESGRTKHPNPNVLRALATLYEMPYSEMVALYTQQQYGVDLRHTDEETGQPSTSRGIPDATEAARLRAQFDHLGDDIVNATRALLALIDKHHLKSPAIPKARHRKRA